MVSIETFKQINVIYVLIKSTPILAIINGDVL